MSDFNRKYEPKFMRDHGRQLELGNGQRRRLSCLIAVPDATENQSRRPIDCRDQRERRSANRIQKDQQIFRTDLQPTEERSFPSADHQMVTGVNTRYPRQNFQKSPSPTKIKVAASMGVGSSFRRQLSHALGAIKPRSNPIIETGPKICAGPVRGFFIR